MGLLDFFRKILSKPENNAADEYIDDITYIYHMNHVRVSFDRENDGTQKLWHQYDVLLAAQGYGWEYMKSWADYMAVADLKDIFLVSVRSFGVQNENITASYIKHGRKCENTPELEEEMGSLAIAGISKILKVPVKIIWHNQTRAIQFITDVEDEVLMRKYIETTIRQSFGTADAMKLGKPIPEEQ